MKISILGATGSIGTQTLDVVRTSLPNARICALSGYSNMRTLANLANEFRPEILCVPSENEATMLEPMLNYSCEILLGEEGLLTCSAQSGANVIVNALVGQAGLAPTLAAIDAGLDVALANKETLVTAGSLIMAQASKKNIRITPIDSEHSAIWQCLMGNKTSDVEKIILTASGGPFRTWDIMRIQEATSKDALRHPNWTMGAKITIDSATLMNKGLELIEAKWLFDMSYNNIDVVIHPQSIIHSMVQYHDGAVMAQLGMPDMRVPILYALSAPERISTPFPRLDFLKCGDLTFEPVDFKKFPCLELAIYAAKVGGTLPAVMNTVNEWAVGQFLKDKLRFYDISDVISQAFGAYTVKPVNSAKCIATAENWATEFIRLKGDLYS